MGFHVTSGVEGWLCMWDALPCAGWGRAWYREVPERSLACSAGPVWAVEAYVLLVQHQQQAWPWSSQCWRSGT